MELPHRVDGSETDTKERYRWFCCCLPTGCCFCWLRLAAWLVPAVSCCVVLLMFDCFLLLLLLLLLFD
jgi:hypothetical protein